MDARIFVFFSLLFIFGFSSYPDSSEISSLSNPIYMQAELGEAEAQYALGNHFYSDTGTKIDLQKNHFFFVF